MNCDTEEVVARLYSVTEDNDLPRISLTLVGLCWSTGKGFKVSKLPLVVIHENQELSKNKPVISK